MDDNPLQKVKDLFFQITYGITTKAAWELGICVECKLPPVFKTEKGQAEYRISAVCELCWDKMMKDLKEEDDEDDMEEQGNVLYTVIPKPKEEPTGPTEPECEDPY